MPTRAIPTRGTADRHRQPPTAVTPLFPPTPVGTMTAGPTRGTVQAPIPARATAVPARPRISRATARTVTKVGAIRTRPTRRRATRTSATRTRPTRSRPTPSRPTPSRALAGSRGTKNTDTRLRPAREQRAPVVTPDLGTRTRATPIPAIRSRATPRPTLRLTRTRGTASMGITGRPRTTRSPTRTRGTAPSATADRTRPTAAVAGSTRIRTWRPPRASRPSRPSPMKQIRPRAGNRGGAAGVSRYQPVRLCPRAAPIAFAEYRSAGAALRLSPRGDLRTGQRNEGPAGSPVGPSFCLSLDE